MDIEATKKELIDWINNLDDETLLKGLLSVKQSYVQGDWWDSISDAEKKTIDKKRVLKAIEKMPDDATVEQILYRLYVIAKIDTALNSTGEKIPHEKMKEEFLGSDW